jgi:hypothetical protein
LGKLRIKRRRDAKGQNAGKYAALRTCATLLVGAGGTFAVSNMAHPLDPAFWGGLIAIGAGIVLFFLDVALTIID